MIENVDTRTIEEIVLEEEADVFKNVILEEDAKDIIISILGTDTHIGFNSESNPKKYCISVVQGHWKGHSIDNNIVTLIKI
jgi:hypothetical protein